MQLSLETGLTADTPMAAVITTPAQDITVVVKAIIAVLSTQRLFIHPLSILRLFTQRLSIHPQPIMAVHPITADLVMAEHPSRLISAIAGFPTEAAPTLVFPIEGFLTEASQIDALLTEAASTIRAVATYAEIISPRYKFET